MQKNLVVNFLLIFFLLIFTHHSLSGEQINERIFDSSEAALHAYPWMVSIRLNLLNRIKRDCGGVIISEIFILTAASCFQNYTIFTQYFTIKAGIHEIGGPSEATEQVRYIYQLILHPNYTTNFYLNDLALIRVSPPFYLDKLSVLPIQFSNLLSVEEMNLTAIGWGGSYPDFIPVPLKEVIVQENVECTQNKSANPILQLCASGKEFLFFLFENLESLVFLLGTCLGMCSSGFCFI
jgi:secreted trypsin-like serine protease